MTKEEYAIAVKGAIDFLNGDYEQTIKALSDKMLKASESMEFEKAAEYRDLINSVKQVAQKQKITNADGEDKDIIALANDDTDAVVQVFFIRNGKLIGRDHFHVRVGSEEAADDVLNNFVKQFYSNSVYTARGHAAERDRGYGCFGAVAQRKARQAGEYKGAAEGHEGKAC